MGRNTAPAADGLTDRRLDYEAWRGLLRKERLPAAVVDLDAFDRNARRAAGMAEAGRKGLRLRVASKSLRCPDLLRRLLDMGAPFAGLLCLSAEEAALLAGRGFDDLLVAYPTLREGDLRLLARLHADGKTVALAVDSAEGLEALARAARGGARPFPAVVDADLSWRLGGLHLGSRRSPLSRDEEVVALARRAAETPGLRFGGLLAYEAQVAGLPDLGSLPVRLFRAAERRRVARCRESLSQALSAAGLSPGLFNGGGTASLAYAAAEPWLTEVAAGSAFLWPALFDRFSNMAGLGFEPAAFFALQAARRPAPGWVTCLGGGFTASGAPGWERLPSPWLPSGARLSRLEGCGEAQTPVRLAAGTDLALGDPVLFRHAKAGELAERFDELVLVSGGAVAGRARTYRGLGLCSP